MRKNILRLIALILSLSCVVSLAACGAQEEFVELKIDGRAVFRALKETVTFEAELREMESGAAEKFTGLPASAQVQFYSGTAYYADCLVLITVEDPSQRNAAVKSLYTYVDQLTIHYRNAQPDQVSKCNNAVIWDEDVYAILCITGDSETARNIVRNADEYALRFAVLSTPETSTQPQNTEPEETQLTEPDETQPQQTEQEETQPQETENEDSTSEETQPEEEDGAYPVLSSKAGTWDYYGEYNYRVDETAFAPYKHQAESTEEYVKVVNSAVKQLPKETTVYTILAPTAIGVVMPDDISAKMDGYEDQNVRMKQVFALLNDNVVTVNTYDGLMQHRDEYLYLRTDSRWTAVGAYYAYEAFCRAKGITPYTLDQRKHSQFSGFKGNLYEDSKITADDIHAYHPYYEHVVSMVFTNRNGEEVKWDVIRDVSAWDENAKYNTFAGGDQPIAVYQNKIAPDGVAIVIKDSYGNAMIPYLVDHYSTVYEIDYRYWEGNIAEFAKEKGATDVIFINNMGTLSTASMVAMLADNF